MPRETFFGRPDVAFRAPKGETGMSRSDAGRLGGKALLATHGREHFAHLGHVVGSKLRDERPGHFTRMARAGGNATSATHGSEYFAQLGRTGGETLRRKKAAEDPDYYSRIGKMSALAAKKRREQQKVSLGALEEEDAWRQATGPQE